MTDWGAYTSGPWKQREDGWFQPPGAVWVGPLGYPSEPPGARADARLVSKAYLIPRLEAMIERLLIAGEWPHEKNAARVLLAELRDEP